MDKRCLVVTYYFPPLGGGGVQRIAKLIKFLTRKGWKFTVITANETPQTLPKDPGLKEFSDNDVEVIHVPFNLGKPAGKLKSNFLTRWLSAFLYLPDIRKKWIKPAYDAVIKSINKNSYDLVLVSAPPYSLTVLAAKLTKELTIPVVMDMRDPWTNNPYKIYPSNWHFKRDRKLELQTISQIKFGISAYDALIREYQKVIPAFNKTNWKTIPNGFDKEDFSALVSEKLDINLFHIAFSGTLYSHINNPEPLFKAINKLSSPLKKKIRFHHIGNSAINLKKLAERYNLAENLVEWGYQEHKRCLNILSGMDVFCFILAATHPNSRFTIGGKVYEYLALKKPILALVPEDGEAAELINNSEAGEVISTKDLPVVTEVLTRWINNKPVVKTTGKIERFTRESIAQQTAYFFEEILKINQAHT